MIAYYNENNLFAAAWLCNLIAAGHVAPGYVDTRSIEDVTPGDLDGFTQCHFFAGIGVWSYALRAAGVPDECSVWTGSCPCQPFSDAGEGGGFDDERHLWPAFFQLIAQRQPLTILGEQVASKDAQPWLDLVQTDLEAMGYAFGAIPFPAAGVGAPHIRDRLYFVAHNDFDGWRPQPLIQLHDLRPHAQSRGRVGELADGGGAGLEVGRLESAWQELEAAERGGNAGGFLEQPNYGPLDGVDGRRAVLGSAHAIATGVLVDPTGIGRRQAGRDVAGGTAQAGEWSTPGHSYASPTRGFWGACDWLPCRDGKARPVEPGTFPLAHGATNRVGRLRAYGNALCAPQAIEWIKTVMDCAPSNFSKKAY